MPHRFRVALHKVAEGLKLNHALLGRAQRRYKVNRKRAFVAEKQKERAQKKADELRAKGGYFVGVAENFDATARRHAHVAYRNHLRAQHYLQTVKRLQQRIHKLHVRHDHIEAELKHWQRTHGVQIHGNKATGGMLGQRWVAVFLRMAANCAKGVRRNFYSMEGAWDIDHEIKPGPAYGHHSDCSSTVTGGAKAAGAPDPNGTDWTGGYTATLLGKHNGWREVSLAELERHGWGFIVYVSSWSDTTGHHTESFVGHGRTVGHGSPPVDFGVPNLFGDGLFRCFIHDN